MKYLIITILISLFACSTVKSFQKKPDSIKWIDFHWTETTISGKLYDKAAIEIPVMINNSKEMLSMQFDIGSQQSFIYGKSISHLQAKDSRLSEIDTIKYDKSNFDLKLNNVNVTSINNVLIANSLTYKASEGEIYDRNNTNEHFIIGTIGADILQNKILIIDYPNNRLAILDSIPIGYKTEFVQTTKTFGKINIPIEINGIQKSLLYDTGASIFEIATTPEGYRLLNENIKATNNIQVPSFGTMLDFKGAQSNTVVKVGNKIIKKPFVYFSEDENVVGFFKESEIFGLTGNSLFLENIVIIDYQKSLFGVVE